MFRLSHLLCISSIFAVVASSHSFADDRADTNHNDWAELRARCERILKQSLDRPLPDDNYVRESVVSRMRSLPTKLVEAKLVAALKDKLPAVRLTAADILLEKTGMKHMPAIDKAVEQCKPATSHRRAWKATIRLRLGKKGALEEVFHWAVLQIGFVQKLTPWTCAMHPQIKQPAVGRCPIDGMNLSNGPIRFSADDFQAQFDALRALTDEKDKRAPGLARAILTSNAAPLWRVRAAHQWAKMAPIEALPHLHLFLHSNDEHVVQEALFILAADFPKQSVREFEDVLKKRRAGSIDRLTAAEGLVRAGHNEHLAEIRRVVDTPAKNPAKAHIQILAIVALGECGTKDDVRRLANCLDGEYRQEAALAIFRLMDR